ncbi:hypothetical protein FEM48_Zijuj12G0105500 [Ziziphus jujuba var. spinosa]|uniref:PI4-kinase N-terminal domain-containing protein n=1 Tax=Ziziphus jujuba var. spinosa TaxID=714518 RepID=A0A978UCT6_ZIZJJ|nr:hypothetical protein FEM48_Zijuj12G0105500 [Ziziphus jujuba var. spinosa]
MQTANIPAVMAAAAAEAGADFGLTEAFNLEVLRQYRHSQRDGEVQPCWRNCWHKKDDSYNGILLAKFVRMLQQFVNISEKGGEVDKLRIRETCSQATALLQIWVLIHNQMQRASHNFSVFSVGVQLTFLPQMHWKLVFSFGLAAGTFFTIMLLGLKFCSCQSRGSLQNFKTGLQLLEDRIYRASLGWFAYEAECCGINSMNFSQSEAHSVSVFVHYISNDKSRCRPISDLKVRGLENGSTLVDVNHQYHPVWGPNGELCCGKRKEEAVTSDSFVIEVWAHPTKCKGKFPTHTFLKSEVTRLVQSRMLDICGIPKHCHIFLTPKAVDENSALLLQLPHWAACSITQALELLPPTYKGHPRAMAYVLRGKEAVSGKNTSFQELLPLVREHIIDGFSPEADSGIPLQSAAKVPIMITFNVVDRYGDHNDMKLQACIFKVGDDCRQVVLALQVISLLRDIFEADGISYVASLLRQAKDQHNGNVLVDKFWIRIGNLTRTLVLEQPVRAELQKMDLTIETSNTFFLNF